MLSKLKSGDHIFVDGRPFIIRFINDKMRTVGYYKDDSLRQLVERCTCCWIITPIGTFQYSK